VSDARVLRPRFAALLALVLTLGAPHAPPVAAQQARAVQCALCHGELELLRRHTATLDDARSLVVSDAMIRASAHDTLGCSSCHTGFSRYPHDRTAEAGTLSCTSCHEPQNEVWSLGVHAGFAVTRTAGQPAPRAATCTDCHGVHDVVAIDTSAANVRARLNENCAACHASAALPPSDPHAGAMTCAGCHSAHDTRRINDDGSALGPLAQPATCGACHGAAADSVPHDAHGRALAALAPAPDLARLHAQEGGPPTCSSCHGAHGMLAPSHAAFEQDMVEACGACHQDYANTYFGTYHGKATALGSEIVATCNACHGAHSILPASHAESHVSDERVVETCAACHPAADARFALYDSHPNPWDRERNPPLFYSFVFMNVLLFGVVGVFTLHTALWWLRLWIDRRRGKVHGHGGDDIGSR
jgi:hypothetical protein